MLSLRDRPVLVVGGGGVALRKIVGLLAEGARPTVIAPERAGEVGELARQGAIELRARGYRAGDVAGFALVFAATGDREVNRKVFTEARDAGIWVNVADDPELCTFQLPARIRRGGLDLAVASAGGAPFAVRRLRRLLERRFGQEWSGWMEAAGRFRGAVRTLGLARPALERRYDEFFDATVDGERLRARVPRAAELDAWLALREGDTPGPAGPQPGSDVDGATLQGAAVRGRATPGQRPALVSLVGAGPGDPGLLTLRARQRLLAADAIVYDRLAAAALPCDLDREVELYCVGKEAGHHPVPQEEINDLLVKLALEGKRTVRFKGGDPFVFGRGSEEAEALRRAGAPCEIVPGVTAGIAAPACAGIPVTHRGEAVRVTLLTAHECTKRDGPQVRWDLLAQDPHATLVGYMGVGSLPEIAGKLIAAGMPTDTPAALVARGTTAGQQTVVSTIGALNEAGRAAGIRAPAVFVIGPTVRHAAALDWFTTRPLQGERLGIFAPAGALGPALDLAGAELVEAPRPVTPAVRVVIGAAPLSGWVLRTAEEVEALEEERDLPGWGPGVLAWCLGSAAAERARASGWRVVELDEGAAPEVVVATVAAVRRAAVPGDPIPARSAAPNGSGSRPAAPSRPPRLRLPRRREGRRAQ
jgi:uroporphyrin-III C-methyltransferase/precorrin-2 dehydrogenase/sirohydrochlorin ferrochelatase